MNATTRDEEKSAQDAMDNEMETTQKTLQKCKADLEKLTGKQTSSPSEERIKANMCTSLAKKLAALISEFQK